jgi:hypothetical protein
MARLISCNAPPCRQNRPLRSTPGYFWLETRKFDRALARYPRDGVKPNNEAGDHGAKDVSLATEYGKPVHQRVHEDPRLR